MPERLLKRDETAKCLTIKTKALAAALLSATLLAPLIDTAAAQWTASVNSAASVRTAPVVPGRRSRVFIFAGVDAACRPLPEPTVEITSAPKQGDITFVPGQDTSIATSANGTCNGTRSKGVGVYYTAREGATGGDHFTVTARLPSGEAFARSFDVRIAE